MSYNKDKLHEKNKERMHTLQGKMSEQIETSPNQPQEGPDKTQQRHHLPAPIEMIQLQDPQVLANQIHLLQYLLQAERYRNDRRKNNYNVIKNEMIQLQDDYIRLQSEMVEIMELSKEVKARKQ